jgi:hypothetical protein
VMGQNSKHARLLSFEFWKCQLHFHLKTFNFYTQVDGVWTVFAVNYSADSTSHIPVYPPSMQFDSISHLGWTFFSKKILQILHVSHEHVTRLRPWTTTWRLFEVTDV